jgi:Na+/H+ antiporter NhaA
VTSEPDGTRPTERRQTPAAQHLAVVRSFLKTEAGGAIVLLAATLAALGWANSPWGDSYDAFWATDLTIRIGDYAFSHDLQHWVNDGLMALFFLLIGLEVRREFDMGEFRERRRLAVPVIAAIGGMVLPVAIFLAIVPGGEASRGWAMVMATDTAFAVGVLALVGRRSSFRLRTFLLTLVIVDDVAAVTVIAVAYTSDVNLVALAIGVALLAGMALLRARGVERPAVYVLLALDRGGAPDGGGRRGRPADQRLPADPRFTRGGHEHHARIPAAPDPRPRAARGPANHDVPLSQ